MAVNAIDVLNAATGLPKRSSGSLLRAGIGSGGALNSGAGSSSAGTSPASTPAAAPTVPKVITFGGTPTQTDYATMIQNDPAFMALKNSLSAQGIASAAQLRGAVQQALINFGAVPENLPSGVLSSTGLDTGLTSQLASQNPFSVLAQLAQQYSTAQDTTKNQLAARGILSSGETGYQLGNLGQANAQQNYNVTNALLGNIGSYNAQYLAGQQAAANQLSQGAFTAESNAAAGAPSGPTITANYDPSTGLYKDVNSSFYDVNGNPVAMPPASGGAYSGSGSGGVSAAPSTAALAPGAAGTALPGYRGPGQFGV